MTGWSLAGLLNKIVKKRRYVLCFGSVVASPILAKQRDREDDMKYLIGFFFGLAVASAVAETLPAPTTWRPPEVYMNAAVGPDGKMAPIRVDDDGHVICSKQ